MVLDMWDCQTQQRPLPSWSLYSNGRKQAINNKNNK